MPWASPIAAGGGGGAKKGKSCQSVHSDSLAFIIQAFFGVGGEWKNDGDILGDVVYLHSIKCRTFSNKKLKGVVNGKMNSHFIYAQTNRHTHEKMASINLNLSEWIMFLAVLTFFDEFQATVRIHYNVHFFVEDDKNLVCAFDHIYIMYDIIDAPPPPLLWNFARYYIT